MTRSRASRRRTESSTGSSSCARTSPVSTPTSDASSPSAERRRQRCLVACLPAEVDRQREEEEARPPVDGVESQRLAVADDVTDEPDDEPGQSHAPPPVRSVNARQPGYIREQECLTSPGC